MIMTKQTIECLLLFITVIIPLRSIVDYIYTKWSVIGNLFLNFAIPDDLEIYYT